MPTTQIKLNAAQVAALRTHTTYRNGGVKGDSRTMSALERRGLVAVPQGFWRIYRITEAGLAVLAGRK